jgi:hypothetical protein
MEPVPGPWVKILEQPVYRPRRPQDSAFYQCIEDHFEAFEIVYDELFVRRYGFLRTNVKHVVYRFLDCGILKNGFARVRCGDCRHEYLLAFSCKRRHFCPSCHQKRVVEFGEWVASELLSAVPHRHIVFSIPKILRRYFLYDRRLLSELSRCAWWAVQKWNAPVEKGSGARPAAINAIQTFGDFLGFHPHCHMLVADGVFTDSGAFKIAPPLDTKALERLFHAKVLSMLRKAGRLTPEIIAIMGKWRHSGFNVYCGPRIWPRDRRAMENLAGYIIRASFSQERMVYASESHRVVYQSKDGKDERVYDALEWMAALCSHVPNRGEQMVRYYGYYSNASRGKRRKKAADAETDLTVIDAPRGSAGSRKSWARLIQKIYEVDPLICPRCQGPMRVISIIEDQPVIRKILTHLGLWDEPPRQRPPPRIHAPPLEAPVPYAEAHQRQPGPDDMICDPIYPVEWYFS